MRIVADRDLCCGSGQCALVAPGVFDQDDADGTVLVLKPRPGPERRAEVEEAVEICPSGAIRLA
ncbi:ferredoxin [Streptomyces hoynatensis]|uniref:Ferredoxin n=1 Tax=Streptomyces hoynatensis TaxID=1141874 RepID=A0A3A9Z9X9_9ACTN|nr:ferredoxin [Streptomyces hoynatensis]RKN44087.1 ferredoxin [Streptomyces hoynatensis]